MTIFSAVGFLLVVATWFAFVIVFLVRPKSDRPPDKKRDPRSITGVVLQGISFALVWAIHRPYFTPLISGNQIVEQLLGLIAIVIAIGSVLFTTRAVKALGKVWSVTARVVEGHKLATHGPYAWVRHPIYTAMLGMLIATSLALTYLLVLIIAIALFMVGTIIRVRSEEKLLRETFGAAFDEYANRVAVIVPGIF